MFASCLVPVPSTPSSLQVPAMAQSGGIVLTTPPPPGLQEATKNSTHTWQEHLESLFHHAKDRFPDVVWELVGDGEGESKGFEDV
jgi:hypothetical protein